MKNRIFSFIFARGGSKGIPKKNLLPLGGISLIGHSIQISKSIKNIEKTFVSTDCDEIAKEAYKYGAEIIKRPIELALDNSPEWEAWDHAVNYAFTKYGKFQIFLSLPTTSPLRNAEDIENCINAIETSNAQSVITICKSQRSPWFNMVSLKENKAKLLIEGGNIFRRQDAPVCFDITTVAYLVKTDFLIRSKSIWDGEVYGVEIPLERSIDIDNYLDYKIAKLFFKEKFNTNSKRISD